MPKALFVPLQLSLGTVICLHTSSLLAQVTSDGTVNTQVNQNGNVAEITGGETRGDNLFHSFQDFSVGTGNEAFFDNANDISNIFSRVTGGRISDIDGAIRANGSANLFLINPAGIIFGENASLNIGGSFLGTTADSILFEDGEFSAADLDNPPLLTVNAPIGLGFRDNPAPINIERQPPGSADFTDLNPTVTFDDNLFGIRVPDGKTFALAGGDITADGGGIVAVGGRIELGAVGESGTLGINFEGDNINFNFPDDLARANVSLTNGAGFLVAGSGGGDIAITARNIEISEGSNLFAGIFPGLGSLNAQSGDIRISASSLSVIGQSSINSSTSGLGNAGNVFIEAQEITFSASNIFTEVSSVGGIGDAGDINITTNSLFLQNGSAFLADTENIGDAGDISIEASDRIVLEGEGLSQITSTVDSFEGATGDAGDIEINTGSLSVNDGGFISTSTSGLGNAGNVFIEAQGLVSFDGRVGQDNFPSRISVGINAGGEGNGGSINIQAESLEITNRAQFLSNVRGIGDAGDINIQATDEVRLINSDIISEVTEADQNGDGGIGGRGDGGNINITTGSLFLQDGSSFLADTENIGDAGNINIEARERVVLEGEGPGAQSGSLENNFIVPSQISTTAESNATGKSGNIDISANEVSIDEGFITSSTFSSENAANINVSANNLLLTNGGQIRASTNGSGNAGNINLGSKQSPLYQLNLINEGQISVSTFGQGDAGNLSVFSNNIEFDGGDNGILTGLFAQVGQDATGEGGNINLGSEQSPLDQLNLINGGQISASTSGQGEPGNINIQADSISLNNGGRIDTATQSETGDGANINLQVADNITLKNNSFISARAFGNADGGNLTIDTNFIIAFPNETPGNGSDIIASAVEGDGGNIDITAESLLGIQEGMAIEGNQTNDIDASSEFSLDGTVTINTPDINLIQEVTELPNNIVEPEQTTAQACQVDRESAAKNRLNIVGKGGIPPTPDLPLNSLNTLIDGETNTISTIPPAIATSQGAIQPARGIKVSESGKITLTAYRTDNAGDRLPEKRNCG